MAASRTKRPRGRPAAAQHVPREVREVRILEVADEVFAARGYHAASMEEIAAGAGVTKPVVYALFASKERLYVACIERAGQELLGRMRTAADPDGHPAERLREGILQFLRFVGERRDGWRVLYAEAGARGGPLADEIADLRERIAHMIARLLEQSAGDSTQRDAIAHAFVGAGESLANWWLAHPEIPPEQVADWLMTLGRTGVEQAPSR